MTMTLTQQAVTIAMVVAGHDASRFLPFLLFPAGKPTPNLSNTLARSFRRRYLACFTVYCLKDVSRLCGQPRFPELISIAPRCGPAPVEAADAASIAGGTICYMLAGWQLVL